MKSKKLLAAALAAVLTLAGCGTTVLSAEETKELLTLSQKTMATVESMAAEMTMEMDMSMGEETAETTTVAKILTQQNPLRMQMNLSATLEDGTEAQNMQMYAEEEDGKLRTYVLAADTWYSQTMELGSLAQYNAEENVTLYLSNLADFSATATEKINDTEATKIEGTLKKDVLQKVLAESGMTETAAAMGVTEEQLAALTESVKSLPLTLWIDADGYVLKYEMNLTEVMQKIMDKAMEAAGLTVEDKAEKVEIDDTAESTIFSGMSAEEAQEHMTVGTGVKKAAEAENEKTEGNADANTSEEPSDEAEEANETAEGESEEKNDGSEN